MTKKGTDKPRSSRTKLREWLSHHHAGRWTLIVVAVTAVIMIGVQVFYPSDRTLPFVRVADVDVGGLSKRDAIDKLFRAYNATPLTVRYADKTIATTADKAGVLIDFQKAADAAARYPLWQRLVPFSLFYKAQAINAEPEIKIDQELAGQFAADIVKQCAIAAQDASITINGTDVKLKPGTDGRECSRDGVIDGLKKTDFRQKKAVVELPVKVTHPVRTDQIATTQIDKAKAIISSGFTVVLLDEQLVVPKETLASWVVFTEDKAKGQYDVVLKDAAIKTYVETLQRKVSIVSTPTVVYLVDGAESRREEGRSGRGINVDATVKSIRDALNTKTAAVTVQVFDIKPSVQYRRNYSSTQQGLEKLVADLAAEKGNYGIVVRELGGYGRSASANGDRKYVTASTYKLFVAYYVLKELEAGRLKNSDVITDGLNVTQCWDEMIVRSANRCALAYLSKYGADTIVKTMHQLGLASVEHPYTWWATPNDLTRYMQKLERGELLQGQSRDFLIGLLKRQIWRYGIPTGVKGITVADKVGFLEDYIHDTAIVYSPRGTYVLTIMTKGGSYAGMADVAKRIQALLNQPPS